MCGICGVALRDFSFPIDREMLLRMTAMMYHRGPDSEGLYVGNGIGLGVRRLSIIDVEKGDQPISNENGTITVICNGEIYNYVELRQKLLAAGHRFRTGSDTEVIVHLYEDHGNGFLNHLRGMFGLALWDAKRRLLVLARDRLGIKPLHYVQTSGGLYFGSEIKPILASGKVDPQLDLQAMKDLFTYCFVVTPRTLITGIQRLPPGHYLTYHQGRLDIYQYWDVTFPHPDRYKPRMSSDEWAEVLRDKLTESVRIHLRSDVPVGAWLSAGVDSSAIVSLMHQITNQKIQTFTLGFEDPDYDELAHQKTLDAYPHYPLVSRRATCNNTDLALFPKAVWHCEDLFTSGVEIPRMILSQLSSSSVKVVLTGEGSDEVFGGYPYYQGDKLMRPFSILPVLLRQKIGNWPLFRRRWPWATNVLLAPREMNLCRYRHLIGFIRHMEFQDKLFSEDLKEILGRDANSEDRPIPLEHFKDLDPLVQLQYFDLKVRLPDYIVHHLDRTSMAYSLETRVPFLDHEFVELCAQVPPFLKMRGFQEKYILRQAMRGLLPQEILKRKKFGLSAPADQWFREDLPDFAVDLLSEKRLREIGYFNPVFVTQMLDHHRSGKENDGRRLLGVLGIQLWHDLFMYPFRSTQKEFSFTSWEKK